MLLEYSKTLRISTETCLSDLDSDFGKHWNATEINENVTIQEGTNSMEAAWSELSENTISTALRNVDLFH